MSCSCALAVITPQVCNSCEIIYFTAWQEEFCCGPLDVTVETGQWLGHHQCHLPCVQQGTQGTPMP